MNCPQCQTANAPDAGFCGSCGARLAVAESATPLGYAAPAASSGYPAPAASSGYPASGGYGAPGGYSAPGGYGAPSGYNAAGQMPPTPPQQPAGYPQGQYQPPAGGGGYPPRMPMGLPPVSFDLNRATTVDKVVAVATFIAMISIWLPWFTVSYSVGLLGSNGSASASATTAHGAWMYLEFIVALVLIAYLVARVAWETLPFSVPVAHAPLLIVGTGVQLLFMLIAFVDVPSLPAGFSVGWGLGAFIGLLAALVAAGPVIVPGVRSYLESRNAAGGARPF